MFSNGFPKKWSTLRKLAWLYRTVINAVSAVLKTAIGNPIHITDALAKPVQALSVAIEPIQDLHGYDNPWPAGGGKNKLPPHAVGSSEINGVTFTFNADETITITGTPTANFSYCGIYGANSVNLSALKPLLNGITAGGNLSITINGNSKGIELICQFNKADGTLTKSRITSSKLATTVPSDAVYMYVAIKITKDYVTAPINATVKLLVGNSANTEDWTPYSNICPISGWTGAKVTRTGKNLLPTTVKTKSPSIDYANGMVTMHPLSDAYQTITFPFDGDGETPYIWSFYAYSDIDNTDFSCDGQPDAGATGLALDHPMTATTTPQKFTFTGILPKTNNGVRFFRTNTRPNASTATIYIYDIQLELGSTATSYEPYAGTTYSITFPSEAGTVYGGTLDVTTGKLTVDMAYYLFDGSTDEAWSKQASGNYYQIPCIPGGGNQYGTGISNMFAWTQDIVNNPPNTIRLNGAKTYIFLINPSAVNSIDELKTYLSTNNLQVAYKLATPIVYDLTPTEITTLLGTNNVWSDSNGDLTLTYLADGNASEIEALNILLGNRYYNNHEADEPTDREALDILLGGTR